MLGPDRNVVLTADQRHRLADHPFHLHVRLVGIIQSPNDVGQPATHLGVGCRMENHGHNALTSGHPRGFDGDSRRKVFRPQCQWPAKV
ncbi:MAG: hypothetical protein ACK56F_29600, partial [bacterium]